jgi:phosphate transport system permease protein
MAALISVPIGLLTSIYLVEYGRGMLARGITFFVDVMTGIPSIVAGLFAFALFALFFGPGIRNGFMGAVALSVLMIPVVVRSSEEILRIVPNELREASLALGVPKWLTVLKVVLPTSLAGLVTGVMLAIARACGETAPVLLVALGNDSINFDPFSGGQMSLSLYVYQQAGVASKYAPGRAWAGALTLVTLVLALTVAAKLLARRNKLAR